MKTKAIRKFMLILSSPELRVLQNASSLNSSLYPMSRRLVNVGVSVLSMVNAGVVGTWWRSPTVLEDRPRRDRSLQIGENT